MRWQLYNNGAALLALRICEFSDKVAAAFGHNHEFVYWLVVIDDDITGLIVVSALQVGQHLHHEPVCCLEVVEPVSEEELESSAMSPQYIFNDSILQRLGELLEVFVLSKVYVRGEPSLIYHCIQGVFMNIVRQEYILFDTLDFVEELLHLPLLLQRDIFNLVNLFVGKDLTCDRREKQDACHDSACQENHFWSPLHGGVIVGFVVAVAHRRDCSCDHVPGLPVNDELIISSEFNSLLPAVSAFVLPDQDPNASKMMNHEHEFETSQEPRLDVSESCERQIKVEFENAEQSVQRLQHLRCIEDA